MKNCHHVCACRDIGELKFAGLQGTVVIGGHKNFYTWYLLLSVIAMLIECTVRKLSV